MRVPAKILLIIALGCGPTPSSTMVPPPPPAPPDAAESNISLVTSAVVVDACPDYKKLDSRAATREIDELVGPCKKVPGGEAHFSATLLPGGRVELAAPTGDPSEGVVPTCLLQAQNQLKHRMRLSSACKFDVKLEERLAEQREP